MSFDPFSIQRYHEDVRRKIRADEPGYAQGSIGETLVSYEAAAFNGPVFAWDPFAGGVPHSPRQLLEQLIIDVARGEAIASRTCFPEARIAYMVADLGARPETFRKPGRIAQMLRAFYLSEDGAGARLLF